MVYFDAVFLKRLWHMKIISPGKAKIQEWIAWAIYFFINIVFCIKYNPFDAIKPVYMMIGYPAVVLLVYQGIRHFVVRHEKVFFIAVSCFILALSLVFLFIIDKYALNVDRWSALEYWSENLKNGQYPYGTKTHLGNYASPYPVWQMFHFPFYLLGDTGYGSIFCLVLFLTFLYRIRTQVRIVPYIVLLLMAPCFWWEFTVRSDSLPNMFLVFIFLAMLFYRPVLWDRYPYWMGLIVGLFLCTKMLVVIPLFLYFFPKFLSLKTMKAKFLFFFMALCGLAVPFLPFLFGEKSILNNPYNPMLVQIRDGNIMTFVVGMVVITWASLKWKNMKTCFFLSGLFLFLTIFAIGVKVTIDQTLHDTIFGNGLDISYFTTALPFILFCIIEHSSYHVLSGHPK